MSGDLRNQGTRLQALLRSTHYPHNVNYTNLLAGYTEEYMPLLRFILKEFSLNFAKRLLNAGYQLGGKSDKQFLETVYKILRDELSFIPKLTVKKFLATGYAEQKLLLTNEVYSLVQARYGKKRRKILGNALSRENEGNKENFVDKDITDKVVVSSSEIFTHQPSHNSTVCEPKQDIPNPTVQERLVTTAEDSFIEERVYSEENAREIFAIPLESEPLPQEHPAPVTCLTTVEVLPEEQITVMKADRELAIREENSRDQEGMKCVCSEELREIRGMLAALTARIDILETKVQHKDIKVVSFADHAVQPVAVCSGNEIQPVADSEVVEEHPGDDDISSYLRNVKERLSSTRSLLRSYNTIC